MKTNAGLTSVLSALGAVGLALTLFGQMEAALAMADWVHYVVSKWTGWTQEFWAEIFKYVPFKLTKPLAGSLTILC